MYISYYRDKYIGFVWHAGSMKGYKRVGLDLFYLIGCLVFIFERIKKYGPDFNPSLTGYNIFFSTTDINNIYGYG